MLAELAAAMRRSFAPNSGQVFIQGFGSKVLCKWIGLGVESINTMSRYLLAGAFGLGDEGLEDLLKNEGKYEGFAESLSCQMFLPALTQASLGVSAATSDRCAWFRREMGLPPLQSLSDRQVAECLLTRKTLDSMIEQAFSLDSKLELEMESLLRFAPTEQLVRWLNVLTQSLSHRLEREAAHCASLKLSSSYQETPMKFPINASIKTYIEKNGREIISGMLNLSPEEIACIFPENLDGSQLPRNWFINTGTEIAIANEDCWKKLSTLCLMTQVVPDELIKRFNQDAGYGSIECETLAPVVDADNG